MTQYSESVGRLYGREIYRLLGEQQILAEWQRLEPNIRFPRGRRVNKRGCVECAAFDREDNNPSAAIFVQGDRIGMYVDQGGTGYSADLFRHAAILHSSDLRKARDHYGGMVGLTFEQFVNNVPKTASSGLAVSAAVAVASASARNEYEEATDDRGEENDFYFNKIGEFREPLPSQFERYCSGKPGVTERALRSCGVIQTVYPKRSPQPHIVFALATYRGPKLWGSGQTGAHLFNSYPGVPITIYSKGGAKAEKTISLDPVGLFGDRGLRDLKSASVVWIAEGHSDTIAFEELLLAAIESDSKFRTHVVIGVPGCKTSPLAEWMKHFAGKTVYVCFDVGDKDDAGQKGARRWCIALKKAGARVRNVILPAGKDGKNDLRNWIVSENKTYADLVALEISE